jgi:hypothetical protein
MTLKKEDYVEKKVMRAQIRLRSEFGKKMFKGGCRTTVFTVVVSVLRTTGTRLCARS